MLGIYDEKTHAAIRKTYGAWEESLNKTLREKFGTDMAKEAKSLLVLIEGILLYSTNEALSKSQTKAVLAHLAKLSA